MNEGNVKGNVRLAFAPELNERICNRVIIKESEFIAPGYFAPVDACIVVKIVISTKPGLVEQFINGLAAIATKIFFIKIQFIIRAVFSTMVTIIYRMKIFPCRMIPEADFCIFQK